MKYNNWHLLTQHNQVEFIESLVESNALPEKRRDEKGKKKSLSDLETLQNKVGVHSWILKGSAITKQATGFSKQNGTGSKQELVRSQFTGSV